MQYELGLYNADLDGKQIQEATFLCLTHNIGVFSIPCHFLNQAKEYTRGTSIKLASIIDFPYGHNPIEVRHSLILHSIRRGATIIELCVNSGLVLDGDYSTLRRDIITCIEICNSKKVDFRLAFEYRLFDEKTLLVLADFFHQLRVPTIISSVGTITDDPLDNIAISELMTIQNDCKTIPASNLWQEKHIKMVDDAKFDTMRFLSLSLLRRCIIL